MVLRLEATPVGDIGNTPPGLAGIQRFLEKTSDSAPGPDGIPDSGWRASVESGAALRLVWDHFAKG